MKHLYSKSTRASPSVKLFWKKSRAASTPFT